MSGVPHSSHQNQFLGLILDRVSFPSAWLHKRSNHELEEATTQILAEGQPLPASRRLVVILPDVNADVVTLPKRIWNLAAPACREVLLMTRPRQEENEFLARMNLVTLAALIRDPFVVVQTQLVLGQSLETAVLQQARQGDVLICFADQQAQSFLKRQTLAKILAETTHLPVYTLHGDVSKGSNPVKAQLIGMLILLICLLTLVAFFAVEVWIDRNSSGTLHMVMQVLVMVIEVWIVGAITSKSIPIF